MGSGCSTALHPRWDLCDNRHGLDAFGFSALPGGQRYSDGAFLSVGRFGLFWSSALDANFEAWFLYLSKCEGQAHFFLMDAGRRGASVRYVRD